MRRQILMTLFAAGIAVSFASGAGAQSRETVFRPFRPTNSNGTPPAEQTSNMYKLTPEGEMDTLVSSMNQLLHQNQELKSELDDTKTQLNQMQRRLESLANILTTGSGESIGSMVHQIRDKVNAAN